MAKALTRTFERTISGELFETIKLLRRLTDAKEIAEKTGFSRPTVDKALNYGHIRDVTLERAIIEYYKERSAEQAQAVREILTNLKK